VLTNVKLLLNLLESKGEPLLRVDVKIEEGKKPFSIDLFPNDDPEKVA